MGESTEKKYKKKSSDLERGLLPYHQGMLVSLENVRC